MQGPTLREVSISKEQLALLLKQAPDDSFIVPMQLYGVFCVTTAPVHEDPLTALGFIDLTKEEYITVENPFPLDELNTSDPNLLEDQELVKKFKSRKIKVK